MQKRQLGRTTLEIAPLVLGGSVFGWTADETTSFAILDRFLEGGLDTIDTADCYSCWVPGNAGGESEKIIGRWMKARGNRDKVVIVTKVGYDMGRGRKGLSAQYIAKAVEDSLRRLQVDTIDLYLSHWPDPSTPYEETLGAYQRLIGQGKIRYCGASNLNAIQLHAALDIARLRKLPRYDVLQPEYNLYDRAAFDGSLRDLCVAEEIGVITYYSLAMGFLSGKYRTEADLARSARGRVNKYLNLRGSKILAALDAVAKRHGAKPAEVAVAWLIARPGVTAPIASATSVEQVESLVRAVSLKLSGQDVEELDRSSAA